MACVIYNVRTNPSELSFDNEYIYIPKEYDGVEIIDPNSTPMFILKENANVNLEGINIDNGTSIFQVQKNSNGCLDIINCTFHNILKQAINTQYQTNLTRLNITGCYFSNYAFLDGIPLLYISAPECNGNITSNTFNQYESGFCFYKNTAQNIYITNCKEFVINDNIFFNNPRGGLFLLNGKIEVTSNEFYNDPTFNSYPYRNFSRDAGAIYCSKLYDKTKTQDNNPNRIKLNLNKIHDFYGKGDVRGIFIDDGRGDVTCYGNIIYNGQSYSIDSRVSKTDPYSSIRNKYQYNILAYPYRLTFGDSIQTKNRPITDHNILLFQDKECNVTTPNSTDVKTTKSEINNEEVKIDINIWKKLPNDIRKLVTPLKSK